MTRLDVINPFHEGELQAQARAGVGDVAKWAGGFVRDYLPEQHRAFHTSLPFLVMSGTDGNGRTWVTMVDGPGGFVTSPDTRSIALDTHVDRSDPLVAAFAKGAEVGVLGIELATRRRNRFSGLMRQEANRYHIDIRQSFGNCPQYIHERSLTRVAKPSVVHAHSSAALSQAQIARIRAADTLFIGSGHRGDEGAASNGFDASHRGGAPGFVHVADATHLHIPDYAGNNFFNTIGNLVSDPRVGLLFVDFDTGGLLHVSGRASVDWSPRRAHDPDAMRMIIVEIDAVLERPGAVGLRWTKEDHSSRRLRLTRRTAETEDIASFYFEPVDDRPLAPFKAGQHLPIEVSIPGQKSPSKRSYSLSGAPDNTGLYRLTVKREDRGQVSRFLHDALTIGSEITAKPPAGDFVVPCDQCPLVLVSAGVGLTPMLAALHETAQQRVRPVWYLHGARNGANHALRGEVDRLVAANPMLHARTYYSQPGPEDILGKDFHGKGRLTVERVLETDLGPDAHFMLCGPAAFLAEMQVGLEAAGVPADHIHIETFGPSGAPAS